MHQQPRRHLPAQGRLRQGGGAVQKKPSRSTSGRSGHEHFVYLSALNNLGLVYQDLKRYDEARELHQQVLAVLEKKGKRDSVYATTLNNLASVAMATGRYEEAERYLEETLALYERDRGKGLGALPHGAEQSGGSQLHGGRVRARPSSTSRRRWPSWRGSWDSIIPTGRGRAGIWPGHGRSWGGGRRDEDMKGLELAEKYYEEIGRPTIAERSADVHRIAVGLVGEGSECFGFDDEISRDHDWGPGFCMWLTTDDHARLGADLQELYDSLPKTLRWFRTAGSTRPAPTGGPASSRSRTSTAGSSATITCPRASPSGGRCPRPTWPRPPTAGCSPTRSGEFTAFRDGLLAFYPEDVRLKKLAVAVLLGRSGRSVQLQAKRRSRRVSRCALRTEPVRRVGHLDRLPAEQEVPALLQVDAPGAGRTTGARGAVLPSAR